MKKISILDSKNGGFVMTKSFDELIAKTGAPKKLSIAVAQDSAVIEAAVEAKKRNIAIPVLFGDADKINAVAKEINADISDLEIVDIKDDLEAAHEAVKYVHEGHAEMYMKGIIDTKNFLKSVLDKEVGLRTGKALSHVAVFQVPGIDHLLFLTDVAFIPYPTLEDKKAMIEYTVNVARACGVEMPKVAPLAAVEVVNPKMPVTVEAAELTKLNEEGEIKNCIVDGPLSMDLAIDPEAAKHKNAGGRKIVGDADILVFPDIHAGNLVYKTLVHTTNSENGCILTGTKAPVILTSRSDTFETKVNSIALAAVVAENLKKLQ